MLLFTMCWQAERKNVSTVFENYQKMSHFQAKKIGGIFFRGDEINPAKMGKEFGIEGKNETFWDIFKHCVYGLIVVTFLLKVILNIFTAYYPFLLLSFSRTCEVIISRETLLLIPLLQLLNNCGCGSRRYGCCGSRYCRGDGRSAA